MPIKLKLAFAGTPEFAACILRKIIDSDRFVIDRVYTQPDRPSGRGRKLHTSAVKDVAQSSQLLLRQPAKPVNIDPENELSSVDILIVAAYGMILPETILLRPRLGCINVHASLLPRWRGAAPIQRAIQAGDKETGITIMQMDAGLDTGQILLQESCLIANNDTAATLHDRLAILGGETLLDALARLTGNTLEAQAQNDNQASYAHKIVKAEAEIDWRLPAAIIERNIRAFNPSPVANTVLNGIRIKIWEAEIPGTESGCSTPGSVINSSREGIDIAASDRLIRIKKLQLPGKKVVEAAAFVNGYPNFFSGN